MLRPGIKVWVRVPATSANLGPGFDTLGMALSYYDELEVETLPAGQFEIEVSGEGAGEVPKDHNHLVVRAISYVFEQLGQALPGLRLKAINQIPHGRGMGSSGAAVVAGVMAAKGLLEGVVELSSERLLILPPRSRDTPITLHPRSSAA